MSLIGSTTQTAWDLVYRISPIILTGGIASSLTSTMNQSGLLGDVLSGISSVGIPIAALIDPLNVLTSTVSGQSPSLDSLFAHFTPMPGSSLLKYSIAEYPFANQTIAANATIRQPINVSMLMECAYRGDNAMVSRIATLAAFQASIAQHNASGGTFTVITPAMIYTNAILLDIVDVSNDPTQPQTYFQMDFYCPLITQVASTAAQSTLMQKLTSGQATDGSWVSAASGNPAAGLIGSIF